MNKYILALCAVLSLASCSGKAKCGYVIECDWNYEGFKTSEKEISCVDVSPSGDGTYTVDPGGSVA